MSSDEKESKKRERYAREDFLAKAKAMDPELFADIIHEVEVEKVVEVDNPELVKQVEYYKEHMKNHDEEKEELKKAIEYKDNKINDLQTVFLAEIEGLKKQIAEFTKENGNLNSQLEKLEKENIKLKKALAAYTEEN